MLFKEGLLLAVLARTKIARHTQQCPGMDYLARRWNIRKHKSWIFIDEPTSLEQHQPNIPDRQHRPHGELGVQPAGDYLPGGGVAGHQRGQQPGATHTQKPTNFIFN